jgi:hypothetical protein
VHEGFLLTNENKNLTEPEKVAPASEEVGKWRNHIFFFWLGISGTVGTLFFGVLSVYFYQASQMKPRLTFGVHPLMTELQRPDYDKELGFIYKGKLVGSESITSVQVAIWNGGTRSIRDSDVLDPLRLVMPDGAAILSVRVKNTTRAICRFELIGNEEDYKSGTCHLKWRILEPGDGAVLQIIYAGSARHGPNLEGAVEGQRDGIVVEHYGVSRMQIQDSAFIPMSRLWACLVLAAIGITSLTITLRIQAGTEAAKQLAQEKAAAAKQLAELQKRTAPAPPLLWVGFAIALCCALAAVVLVISGSRYGPPFGW